MGLLLEATLAETSDEAQLFTSAQPPYPIVAVNAAWTRLCGYTESEALGQTCKMLQGPSTSRGAIDQLHVELRGQPRPFMTRLLNYTKSGDPFINYLTIEPCTDASGTVTHFRGTLRPRDVGCQDQVRVLDQPVDVALAKALADHLPASIDEAKAMVGSAVVITESFRPFRIRHVNEEWCRVCGFSVEEAIGRTCSILHGPGTDSNPLAALSEAAEQQRQITVRLVNYAKVHAARAGKSRSSRRPVTCRRATHSCIGQPRPRPPAPP